MKSVNWLVVVVLAVLYAKYYHVTESHLLLLLPGLYAGRVLSNRLRCLLSPDGTTNAEEDNPANAVDVEY